MSELSNSFFASYCRGRHIETKPRSGIKYSIIGADAKFDKLTEDIKRLSCTNDQSCILPSVNMSSQTYTTLCTPSPLENLPLAGKRITIRRKNIYADMWMPSEAAPEPIAPTSLNVYPLPDLSPSLSRFRQPPWCDLLNLSIPYNRLPTLEMSRPVIEPVAYHTDIKSIEQVVDETTPLLNPAPSLDDTFYQEPGMMLVVIPRFVKTEADALYSVSGHNSEKARTIYDTPILSVFHLFQTEIVSEADPFAPLTTYTQCLPQNGPISEVVKEDKIEQQSSGKESKVDEYCSNFVCSVLGTGSSSSITSQSQIQGNTQEESMHKCIFTPSKLVSYKKLNYDFASIDEHVEMLLRTSNKGEDLFVVTTKDCKAITNTTEGQTCELHIPTEDNALVKLKNIETGCFNQQTQCNLGDMDSDLKDGCAFYRPNRKPKPKLKRPSQTTFTFSKINTLHIDSEDRKSVMQRLTKLPLRCLMASRKSDPTPNNDGLVECKNCLPSFWNPEKDTQLSTINLELDVTFNERKVPVPIPVRSCRYLKKSCPDREMIDWADPSRCAPASNSYQHFDNSISQRIGPSNMAHVVFVGKSAFIDTKHTVTNDDDLFIHGGGLQPSTVGDAICENKTEHIPDNEMHLSTATAYTFSPKEQMQILADGLGGYKDRELDRGVQMSCSQKSCMSNPMCTCLSDIWAHTKPQINVIPSSPELHTDSHITNEPLAATRPVLDYENEAGFEEDRWSQEEDEASQEFDVRSRSSTVCSAISLDDVPYNSRADSCRDFHSPFGKIPYADEAVKSDKYSRTSADSEKPTSSYLMHPGDTHEDDAHFTVSLTGPPEKSEHVLRKQQQKCIGDNLYLADSAISQDNSSCLKLHQTNKEGQHDGSAILALNREQSTLHGLQLISDESYHKDKVIAKVFSVASDERGDDTRESEFQTMSCKLCPQLMKVQNCTSQHVPGCVPDQPGEPQFLGHYIADHNDLGYTERCTDNGGCCIHPGNLTEKIDSTRRRETVGHTFKNVRFSDQDNVISLKTLGRLTNETPPVTFHTPLPRASMSLVPDASSKYDHAPGIHRVLNTQRLQFRATAPQQCARSHLAHKSQLGNPLYRYHQVERGSLNPRYLKAVKWSSYSYSTCKPRTGDICIKGRGIARQGSLKKVAASEWGTPGEEQPPEYEDTVMYTICHKCEKELHVKFQDNCLTQRPHNLEDGIKHNEVEDKKVTEIVAARSFKDKLNCEHMEVGCCQVCAKVRGWTLFTNVPEDPLVMLYLQTSCHDDVCSLHQIRVAAQQLLPQLRTL